MSPKSPVILRFEPDDALRKKIDNGELIPLSSADPLSASLKGMMDLSGSVALTGAYRMVIPAGAFGRVMVHKANSLLSGTFGASLIGPTGKITTGVGYAPLAAFGGVFIVYSILAFLTGQYFQNTITKHLRRIVESLDQLRQLILNIQDSHFDASVQYLDYVLKVCKDIKASDHLRVATLTNIQRLSIENRAYHILHMKEFHREMAQVRNDEKKVNNKNWDGLQNIDRKREATLDLCRKAVLSLSLHVYFAATEAELSESVSPSLFQFQLDQVQRLCDDTSERLVGAREFWDGFSKRADVNECDKIDKEALARTQRHYGELHEQLHSGRRDFERLLQKLKRLDEKALELGYLDGEVYIPKSLAIVSA